MSAAALVQEGLRAYKKSEWPLQAQECRHVMFSHPGYQSAAVH
jgi:hypothetical protein